MNNKLPCSKNDETHFSRDEVEIINVVPSNIIGKKRSRTIFVYSKEYLNDSNNCPCPVPYCKLGVFALHSTAILIRLKYQYRPLR